MVQSLNWWDPPAQQAIPSITPHQQQGTPTNGTQRQRICFWAAAAFAWAVWALAVTAAAHDEWLARVDQDVVGGFDAGNELVLYFCDDGLDVEYGRFCNLYRGFTATQFAATVTCSIAVALLAIAAFRPAVAGCASVKPLATAGGMLLITYAVFQLGAAALVFFLERQVEDTFNELTGTASSEDGITELGLTFWVGLAGIVLALLTSVCLLVKARHAGDGPFYGAGRLWVASGLAWVVWALAVTVTAHDEWLLLNAEDIPLGDVKIRPGESCGILDELDYDDDQANEYNLICDFHRGFTATQFAATAICSLAVALLALAAFRPAAAGCASVKSLSVAGGVLLIVYVAAQIGAGVLAYLVGKEWERIFNEVLQSETNFEVDFGPMFWAVVCGVVLAMFVSCNLISSAKSAENGPLCGGACCVIESGAPIKQREEMKTAQAWEPA